MRRFYPVGIFCSVIYMIVFALCWIFIGGGVFIFFTGYMLSSVIWCLIGFFDERGRINER